ncbi:MAG: hypothetical protein V2J51_00315 [Erythrobacter sp.]|nr:hypothetical protein [Erythrobacter sp.]
MRKIILAAAIGVSALSLAACAEDATEVSETDDAMAADAEAISEDATAEMDAMGDDMEAGMNEAGSEMEAMGENVEAEAEEAAAAAEAEMEED